MSNRYNRSGRAQMRNARRAGRDGLSFTASVAGKTAGGLFRWMTTDHSGMTRMMAAMPQMGFVDSMKYILSCFLYVLLFALLQGAAVFLFIGFGIPWLLS